MSSSAKSLLPKPLHPTPTPQLLHLSKIVISVAGAHTPTHSHSFSPITATPHTDLWGARHPFSPVVFNLRLPEEQRFVSADVRAGGWSPARCPRGAEHQLLGDALLLALFAPQDVVLAQDMPVMAGLRCPQQVFGLQVAQDRQRQLQHSQKHFPCSPFQIQFNPNILSMLSLLNSVQSTQSITSYKSVNGKQCCRNTPTPTLPIPSNLLLSLSESVSF